MAMLETCDLRKEFGTLVAVDDVNLNVECGEVLGLIGPNGAGKTTLLRILATLLDPTSGSAKILERDVATEYLKVRKDLGYMPDFFSLYKDLTLYECLEFFARAYEVDNSEMAEKIHNALEFVGLEKKKDIFIRHLSRGMTQRMGVATLLVRDPKVLLLDEPASGLDPLSRVQLKDILIDLASKGKSIIISSHILSELSGFCSHIAIMNKGRIALQGSCDEIQRRVSKSKNILLTAIDGFQAAVDYLGQREDVDVKSFKNDNINFEITCDDEALAGLLRELLDKGVKVTGFSEQKMNLEDVFMSISKQN